jgi:hypothetical protein
MRLLVTGSRTWKDYERLCRCLDEIADQFARVHSERFIAEGLMLMSGHAYGADAMAEAWFVTKYPLEQPEIWKAEWDRYYKRAGIVRNTAMVDSNPDACVAFIMECDKHQCAHLPLHGTHGAVHCADYAERQGIPTTRYYGGKLA